ncbi:MAG TPA: hypothetical protein VK650_07400, partial [Steroidobacteraceae bacterium]|nr:hypothetical protein [Steroidobacteraceae bacterium]
MRTVRRTAFFGFARGGRRAVGRRAAGGFLARARLAFFALFLGLPALAAVFAAGFFGAALATAGAVS